MARRNILEVCAAETDSSTTSFFVRSALLIVWVVIIAVYAFSFPRPAAARTVVFPVDARTVTFEFSGRVTFVDPVLSEEFSVGDTFSGFYRFQPLTPDSFPTPRTGVYRNAVTQLAFRVGAYEGFAKTGDITLSLETASGVSTYLVRTGNRNFPDGTLVGPSVSGFPLQFFGIQLTDTDATVFSSDELPLVPPNLSAFESGILRIGFVRPGESFAPQVAARLPISIVRDFHRNGELELVPIPAPTALALLATGLTGLGYIASRSRARFRRPAKLKTAAPAS